MDIYEKINEGQILRNKTWLMLEFIFQEYIVKEIIF